MDIFGSGFFALLNELIGYVHRILDPRPSTLISRITVFYVLSAPADLVLRDNRLVTTIQKSFNAKWRNGNFYWHGGSTFKSKNSSRAMLLH